jgi:hypothetical protein
MDDFEASSSVSFEVDSSSGQLGSKPPKEITEGSQRAESLDFHRWGIRADILSLSHGSFQKKPASLISFNFRFLFDDGGSRGRFSEAKIVTTFQSLPRDENTPSTVPTGGANDAVPIVKLFGPKLIDGPVTIGSHNDQMVYSATIGGPDTLPVKPEIGISRSNGVEYLKDYKMQIKGRSWSTPGLEHDNMAIWTLLENSKQGDGIPLDFRAAVIIQHNGQPFQGTIKISTRTKWGLKLFGWPWSVAKPLRFSPSIAFGESLGVSDFESLDESHWARLCDFPGVVSVSAPTFSCFFPAGRMAVLTRAQSFRLTDQTALKKIQQGQ